MYRVLECIKSDHDLRLVLLAVIICAATSATAWFLYGIAERSSGLSRWGWIVQTAVAAGSGIWATHFIAMLAFKTAVSPTYDPALTILSLLIAISVTGVGFCIAEIRFKCSAIVSGSVIGLGIAAMHYSGMQALSLASFIHWETKAVVASIILGMALSAAAMWAYTTKGSSWLAAVLLTAAICTLHFTAMSAATVQVDPTLLAQGVQIDSTLLATAIAGVTVLVILSGLTAALINHDTTRELSYRADHDHLTGLPNRRCISRIIDSSIGSKSAAGFALLFIDLDKFKAINDIHGHAAGDFVLKQAAERLRTAISERAIVGRAGGDEFIVLHLGSRPSSARRLADAIVMSFRKPFNLPGGDAELVGASVGVALYPRDGRDGDSLLKAADGALYRVKRAGGGAALAA